MNKKCIKLFKCYEGKNNHSVSAMALKFGVLINSHDPELVNEAIMLYGKDGEEWNKTLHKSFDIVAHADLIDLYLDQIIHYITTYGFESLGVYSDGTVYVPTEKLNIPELKTSVGFTYIEAVDAKTIKDKVNTLITSGIALSKETIEDLMFISDKYIDLSEIDKIKNRELKIALYDKYNIVPKNPDDFLRYLIFKLTKETLKIKSKELVYKIKSSEEKKIGCKLLYNYVSNYGYEPLASIFLRNKVYFLSMKINKNEYRYSFETRKQMNKIINKISKLSNKYHKPMTEKLIDNLFNEKFIIENKFSAMDIYNAIKDTTIWREIRILNGINYRLENPDINIYPVRNGKGYIKNLKPHSIEYTVNLTFIKSIIYKDLIDKVKDKFNNKAVYIPNGVVYAAPTSEKGFLSNIPKGSTITIPKSSNLIFGIHWNNLPNSRVDLDLACLNESIKYGWDGRYRSNDRDVLFSGDVTSAPINEGGATEALCIKNMEPNNYIITLNDYTMNSHLNEKVLFDFVICEEKDVQNLEKNYIIDPNSIIHKMQMYFDGDSTLNLGTIIIGDNDITVLFNNNNFGKNTITSSSKYAKEILMYANTQRNTQITLNDIIIHAGGLITIAEDDKENIDIDLSLESLNKDTLISLLN